MNYILMYSQLIQGWLSVNIRCKKCEIGRALTQRRGGGFKARHIFLQCIELKQSHAGIKNYLFSNTSSSFRYSPLTDCFWQSLQKLSKTLPEIGSQGHFQKLSVGDDHSPVQRVQKIGCVNGLKFGFLLQSLFIFKTKGAVHPKKHLCFLLPAVLRLFIHL